MKLSGFVVSALATILFFGCAQTPTTTTKETPVKKTKVTKMPSQEPKAASQKTATKGDKVHVHYTGWLEDTAKKDKKGKEFDSSLKRGVPFSFTLGAGQVIKGWDEGVMGMTEGQEKTLNIPYSKAYGERGRPPVIPPKANLIFDVKLVKIEKS